MLNAFRNRDLGPLMQYWAQGSDTRMQTSDVRINEADSIFEGTGWVQSYEVLSSFRFIRGDALL
jgi:hypothetical protein